LLYRAQLEHQPERDAALVLRFESTADIAQRPVLVRKNINEPAHEDDMQPGRLAGERFRQDGGACLSIDRLRQRDAPFPAHMI